MVDNLPLVFDIQRSSFEDGPGIRTVVFFKGCPLRCAWCHNPESQSVHKEILWYAASCSNCNACASVCRNNAISNRKDEFKIDRTNCIACGDCAGACDYHALKAAGKEYSVGSLAEIILKDKTYYDTSGGGVTFSGGEPLMFMDFLAEVCKRLKEENIDIAVQTCGYFNFSLFEQIISPYIDTLYFDLKITDNRQHIEFTGQSNSLILDNLTKLFSPKKHKIFIRTPLIPGITDTSENLDMIKELIKRFEYDGYEELLFNESYYKKLNALGRTK